MTFPLHRLLAAALLIAGAASCVSTTPTAEDLDAYLKTARAAHQAEYAALERQRATGELTAEDYRLALADLDHKVQDQADTMAWNRHALAQSEMKANAIPTPDQPIDLRAPGASSIPNSMYNTPRVNPMTGQQQSYLGTGGRY